MFDPPKLRDDLPRYPGTLQLLRVTTATVPGPTGGTSTGPGVGNVPPVILYVSSTQQLRTDTLAPRDREPCLVDDVNSAGLSAGYYLGRLAGSFSGLPVYEVATFASTASAGSSFPQGAAGLPGLTPAQLAMVNASLTPVQIADLNNLTACQLQVLLQLPVVNIQLLANLTPTQLQNVVDGLQFQQLLPVATQVTSAQTLVLSSAYPQLYQAINLLLTPTQSLQLLQALTSQQLSTLVGLTPQQLQVVGQLTTAQQQQLTGLTPLQVSTLVGNLTSSQVGSLLSNLSTAQLQQLGNNFTPAQVQQLLQGLSSQQLSKLPTSQLLQLGTTPAPLLGNQFSPAYLPAIVGQPSSVPAALPGYAQVVVDNTGKVWANIGGVWTNLTGGSGSASTHTLTSFSGGTTASYAQVFDLLDAAGVIGSLSIKNTHPTNPLNFRVTAKDMYGTSGTSADQPLAANTIMSYNLCTSFTAPSVGPLPPFQEVKIEVKDGGLGSSTYQMYRSVAN